LHADSRIIKFTPMIGFTTQWDSRSPKTSDNNCHCPHYLPHSNLYVKTSSHPSPFTSHHPLHGPLAPFRFATAASPLAKSRLQVDTHTIHQFTDLSRHLPTHSLISASLPCLVTISITTLELVNSHTLLRREIFTSATARRPASTHSPTVIWR
jgi:hypothetical protein